LSKASRLFLFGAVALLALMGGYFAHIWFEPDEPASDPAQVLLAASLEDLHGQIQPLAQWQGKVMVVNFWATWCPPCLKEIPEFVRLQQRYGSRGVQFVGLAIDDKVKVAAFAAKMGMNYPVLIADRDGLTLARNAGNPLGGLPFTVIIDRQGRTARVELGVLDEAKLAPILELLL
jgi:thiol-disulfide isomerase/thioredoxin